LCLQPYLNAINAETSSVTVKHLSSRTVEEIPLPLPPLPEQHRIVEKIEALFSELDKGIEQLKTAQQQLKVYRQSVLKWAFEGRLTAEWRSRKSEVRGQPARRSPEDVGGRSEVSVEGPESQTSNLPTLPLRQAGLKPQTSRMAAEPTVQYGLSSAQELLSRIRHEREEQAKTTGKRLKPIAPLTEKELAELPALPEGWAWVKVGEISDVVRGQMPRPAGNPVYYSNGTIPWITVGEITKENRKYLSSVSSYINEAGKTQSRFVEAGSLLLTNSGATLGVPKITQIDGCIHDGNLAILSVESPLKDYLYHFFTLQTGALRSVNQGAAQPNLNTTIVKALPCPLPPTTEQHQIVQEIETRLSVCDKLEETITASLQQSEALRQSILKNAFEGKLVPQDPNDPPASELLEKIKKGKANEKSVGSSKSATLRGVQLNAPTKGRTTKLNSS
jgi:type I restriction enzyme S subunit